MLPIILSSLFFQVNLFYSSIYIFPLFNLFNLFHLNIYSLYLIYSIHISFCLRNDAALVLHNSCLSSMILHDLMADLSTLFILATFLGQNKATIYIAVTLLYIHFSFSSEATCLCLFCNNFFLLILFLIKIF